MAADVGEVFLGDAVVGVRMARSTPAAVVAVVGRPDHVPLGLCVLTVLEAFLYGVLVHDADELLELRPIDDVLLVLVLCAAANIVPRVVHLLGELFARLGTALLVLGDPHLRLPSLLRLLLLLCERACPRPNVLLQRCEERLLPLELFLREQRRAIPRELLLLFSLLLLLSLLVLLGRGRCLWKFSHFST